MSMTLLEVIEYAGYDLELREDAEWFLSKQNEFNELMDKVEETIEKFEDMEDEDE